MGNNRLGFLFLNVGHFLDHLFVLIFATASVLRLTSEWNMDYAELIPYATPGFVAFGLCALPAGWLADKWSREGMMIIFFVGIGVSSIATGFADTPLQIAAGLLAVGVFAAIYHPVGLAMIVHGRDRTGVPLAVNGVFGNMGVASAALLSGLLIDVSGWRAAFVVPGAVAVAIGLLYATFVRAARRAATHDEPRAVADQSRPPMLSLDRRVLLRVFSVIVFTTAVGGLIFQSTTFALPKVFDERLQDLAATGTSLGWYTFLVFALAALAQLVVGYLVDRYPVRVVFAVVATLQAVFLAAMVPLNGVPALVTAVAFMLAVFGQIPINDVLVGRVARSEWRSRAYAVRYIVTFTVMASAVPLIAWLHAHWGFSALFGVMSAAACFIFAAVLALPRHPVVLARAPLPAR